MRKLAARIAKAGTSLLPGSSLKRSSRKRTGNVDALLLWICGIVEYRLGAISVVVCCLHNLHKTKERNTTMKGYTCISTIPRSTIHFFFFIGKRSDKNGADKGGSLKIRPTTKTSLTACSGILISHSPDRCERPPDVRGH